MTHHSIDSDIHEEVATAALRIVEHTRDDVLADMVKELHIALDSKAPSSEIVARIRAYVAAASIARG